MPNPILKQYLDKRKHLIRLNGKVPIDKNWTTASCSETKLRTHNGNFGWKLGPLDFVVDVDPRNNGAESFDKLQSDLNIQLSPTVITPSGGFHCYLKLPNRYAKRKLRKMLKQYPGIDFLSKGNQCVIAGSKTPAGVYKWVDETVGFIQHEAPPGLLMLLAQNEPLEKKGFDEIVGGKSGTCSEERILEWLSKIDPSCSYEEWLRVGMALHDWDPIRGRLFWDDWSVESEKYKLGEIEKKWEGFRTDNGVSVGTLAYLAEQYEFQESLDLYSAFKERIRLADEADLELVIMPEIKTSHLNEPRRERLADALKQRYKEICGVNIPINQIRDMIRPVEAKDKPLPPPDWCKPWVYVLVWQRYFHLERMTAFSKEAFNLECGKYVPRVGSKVKQNADKYVSDNGYIPNVDTVAYLPHKAEQIVDIGTQRVLNTFDHASVPKAAKTLSPEGEVAVGRLDDHISVLLGDEHADFFIQWLAHQVQHPGQLLRMAPLIQSVQGLGKSYFGQLLRCVLGEQNVGVVSSAQVKSEFNSWARGTAVNVLEELKISGKNRYVVADALKPLLTDQKVMINEKGIPQYEVRNTTNYICFTNHKNAIPLDEHDRRWWVIHSPVTSLKEFEAEVDMKSDEYFERLYSDLQAFASDLRRWLLDYPISDEFRKLTRAPMTPYKQAMIETDNVSIEGRAEVMALLKKGGRYFDERVISSADLFMEFEICYGYTLTNHQKNSILRTLGYIVVAESIKIDKRPKRVWSIKPMTNAEIRDYFAGPYTPTDADEFDDLDDI